MNINELIRMFILDVITDDYEDLAMIYRELGRHATRCGMTITTSEINQALLDLIGAGLAKVYRLSPWRPNEEVHNAGSLFEGERYYFLSTEKGRELQLSDYPCWPFDEHDSLKEDWSPPAS